MERPSSRSQAVLVLIAISIGACVAVLLPPTASPTSAHAVPTAVHLQPSAPAAAHPPQRGRAPPQPRAHGPSRAFERRAASRAAASASASGPTLTLVHRLLLWPVLGAVGAALYLIGRRPPGAQCGARDRYCAMLSFSGSSYTDAKSKAIFAEAQALMPGGVSSPVRAFQSVGGDPVVFERVKGAYVWDVDGNHYIDYVMSFGPAIAGHANDEVLAALEGALGRGTSFGAPSVPENALAHRVIEAVPGVEMVRFTNSGTEACMAALRLVRAYTGRSKVVKFGGSYHGHADSFLVQAGRAGDSPGVPPAAAAGTLVARYNDLASVRALLEAGDVAAVVLEPVGGNAGFIPAAPEFLRGLRALTAEHGALLWFDEVMTGFRVAYGGAQAYYGVTPDVTTLGKIVGGGMPVGAYGGRRDIMALVAPSGPVYQAGTLSGNPLAMAAGLKTLEIMRRPGAYERLEGLTKRLVDGLLEAGREAGHAICGGSVGGMFGYFFCEGPVTCYEEGTKADTAKFAKWHRMMRERGVYLAPTQFEAGFTSLAHTDADVDRTIAIAREVMKAL